MTKEVWFDSWQPDWFTLSARDTYCEVQQPGCDGDQSAPSSTEVME